MLKNTIENKTSIFNGREFNLYFIQDKNDLAEFIEKHYHGRMSKTNKIPIKAWFLYEVDDSGDYIYDYFTLLSEFKDEVLKAIIDSSCLYKKLQEIK